MVLASTSLIILGLIPFFYKGSFVGDAITQCLRVCSERVSIELMGLVLEPVSRICMRKLDECACGTVGKGIRYVQGADEVSDTTKVAY